MAIPANGQSDLASASGLNRYVRNLVATGNATSPSIATAPAAFSISGAEAMQCAADPDGVASRSALEMWGGGGNRTLAVAADNLTVEADVLLDWNDAVAGTVMLLDARRSVNPATVVSITSEDGTTFLNVLGQSPVAFDTDIPIGTVVTLKVIYERNSQARAYVNGALQATVSHSVDSPLIGWAWCCDVTDGDLVDEIEVRAWFRSESWRSSVVTEDDLYEVPPCQVGAPGTIDGDRKQTLWTCFPRGYFGDGGDEDDLEVVFQLSDDDAFTDPDEIAVDVTSATDWTAVAVFDVDPSTQYWHRAIYRRKTGEVEIGQTSEATFTTISAPGHAPMESLRFVIGGDTGEARTLQPMHTFETARSLAPHVVVHLGDICYGDQNIGNGLDGSDPRNVRYEMQYFCEGWRHLAAEAAFVGLTDGHDGLSANYHLGTIAGNPTAFEAQKAIAWNYLYSRQRVQPAPTEAEHDDNDAWGSYFDTAAVRVILLDGRRFREQPTSGTAHERLGDAQKAWVKNLLATNTRPLVLVMTQNPVSARWTAEGHARAWWPYFDDEAREVFGSFTDNNVIGAKLIIFSADRHATHIGLPHFDDPNILEAISAPLNQGTSPSEFMWDSGVEYYANTTDTQIFTALDINEQALTVDLTVRDGVTGNVLYTHPTIELPDVPEVRIRMAANWSLCELSSQNLTHVDNVVNPWGVLTQETESRRPLRVAEGLPSLRDDVLFDGSNDRMVIPPDVLASGDKTLFFTFRADPAYDYSGNSNTVPRVASFIYGESLRTEVFYHQSTGTLQFINDGSGNHTGRAISHTAGDRVTLGLRSSGGTITMTVDGEVISHSTGNSAAAGTLSASHIGARPASLTSSPWPGTISAALAIPEALDDETMEAVSAALVELRDIPPVIPELPANIVITAGENSALIEHDEAEFASGYEYRIDEGEPVGYDEAPHTITPLAAGEQVSIEIRAVNPAGESEWSTPQNVTPTFATSPATIPRDTPSVNGEGEGVDWTTPGDTEDEGNDSANASVILTNASSNPLQVPYQAVDIPTGSLVSKITVPFRRGLALGDATVEVRLVANGETLATFEDDTLTTTPATINAVFTLKSLALASAIIAGDMTIEAVATAEGGTNIVLVYFVGDGTATFAGVPTTTAPCIITDAEATPPTGLRGAIGVSVAGETAELVLGSAGGETNDLLLSLSVGSGPTTLANDILIEDGVTTARDVIDALYADANLGDLIEVVVATGLDLDVPLVDVAGEATLVTAHTHTVGAGERAWVLGVEGCTAGGMGGRTRMTQTRGRGRY